jgi:hypothetical protein
MNRVLVMLVMSLGLLLASQESASQTATDDERSFSAVASNNPSKFRLFVTGGAGFRYELARKYGLHMGVDVATGPAGQAMYVQFGSAWMRP